MIFGRTILHQPIFSSESNVFNDFVVPATSVEPAVLRNCLWAIAGIDARGFSCHDHAHCQRVGSPKVSEEVCAHGCHHFADINVSDAKVAKLAGEESPTIPWHDSEDCAVCQSLANPVGFVGILNCSWYS